MQKQLNQLKRLVSRSQANADNYRRAEQKKLEAMANATKAAKELTRAKKKHSLEKARYQAKESSVRLLKRQANEAAKKASR